MQVPSKFSIATAVLAIVLYGAASAAVPDDVLSEQIRQGLALQEQKAYAEAEEIFRATLERAERLKLGDADQARALDYLAQLYMAEARYSEAQQLYTRSLPMIEKSFGPESVRNGPALAKSLRGV